MLKAILRRFKLRFHKREPAEEAAPALFFVLMGAFVFTLIAYVSLTAAMLMSHQHEVDDILTDAVLAGCIGDKEYYFDTRESSSGGVIRFGTGGDINQCQEAFVRCLNEEMGNGYNKFFDNLKVEDLIFYEVDNGNITITNFEQVGENTFDSSEYYGSVGSTKTPGGETVERTSVYAKLTFDVHAYFIIDITQNVSREVYSTIKIDDASIHQGTHYFSD